MHSIGRNLNHLEYKIKSLASPKPYSAIYTVPVSSRSLDKQPSPHFAGGTVIFWTRTCHSTLKIYQPTIPAPFPDPPHPARGGYDSHPAKNLRVGVLHQACQFRKKAAAVFLKI